MRMAIGVVLILVGGVWVLQGLDVAFAPQSFMTNDSQWVLWGALTVAAGIAIIWRARKSG